MSDRHRLGRTSAALGIAGVLFAVSGCSDDGSSAKATAPATVQEVAGSKQKQITLTPEAAERIALTTAAVASRGGASVIPYGAVVYDADGSTWTYTATGPLSFVRTRIEVERIEGDEAVLRQSPAAGTEVVTVGAAMLYGVETGVGK